MRTSGGISSAAAVNYGTATADRIPAVTSILAVDNSQIVRIHGIFTTNLMERGFTDGEVKMAQSVLRVAAERHRLVASILSDPYDRAIINQYADEVEGLSRLEVTAERSPGTDAQETRLMEIGGVLGKIFKPEPSFLFDELIEALDVLASPPPWKPL